MKSDRRIPDSFAAAALILALAGFLWAFSGIARASETERSMKPAAGTEVSGDAVTPEGTQEPTAPAAAAKDASALSTSKERLSYALGMVLGRQFRDQSMEVDPNAYLRGLEDGLSGGKTLLTDAAARSMVNALQRDLKRKRAATQAPGDLADIAVSFKLNPELTRGLYMGDRWVSPPTFTSRAPVGTEVVVDARAEGRDGKGRTTKIIPRWTPADPEMVTVTPGEGKDVKITVKRAGETTLEVAAQGFSKDLSIKAIPKGGAIRVEITQ